MGKRFGECLKNALDSKKMSVSDFSKASGIKRENIYRYINGEREPKEMTIKTTCEALGLHLSEFYMEDMSIVLNEREKNHITEYRKLSDYQQGKIDGYMENVTTKEDTK